MEKGTYIMSEIELMTLIQGKPIHLIINEKFNKTSFYIEIIPPNDEIIFKLKDKDWEYIKSLIREHGNLTLSDHEKFIEMIEKESISIKNII